MVTKRNLKYYRSSRKGEHRAGTKMASLEFNARVSISMVALHSEIGNVSSNEAISQAAYHAYVYMVLRWPVTWRGAPHSHMTIDIDAYDNIIVNMYGTGDKEIENDGVGIHPVIPVRLLNSGLFIKIWDRVCADNKSTMRVCENEGGDKTKASKLRLYEWTMVLQLEGESSTITVNGTYLGDRDTAPLCWEF